MNEYSRISLLESILMISGCKSLNELSSLSRDKRVEIAKRIGEDVPVDMPTLQDYNEVLHYLLCRGPLDDRTEARNLIIEELKK